MVHIINYQQFFKIFDFLQRFFNIWIKKVRRQNASLMYTSLYFCELLNLCTYAKICHNGIYFLSAISRRRWGRGRLFSYTQRRSTFCSAVYLLSDHSGKRSDTFFLFCQGFLHRISGSFGTRLWPRFKKKSCKLIKITLFKSWRWPREPN